MLTYTPNQKCPTLRLDLHIHNQQQSGTCGKFLSSICKRSILQPALCEPAGLVDEGNTSKPEKESESPSANDKKIKRRFSLSKSSKSTKLKSSKKLPVVPYKRVPFTADVSAYILRLYLRKSFLELPEHAA